MYLLDIKKGYIDPVGRCIPIGFNQTHSRDCLDEYL